MSKETIMSIISRLKGQVERQDRVLAQLEHGGLGNSDAARAARSRRAEASRKLAKAEGEQDPPRWQGHP